MDMFGDPLGVFKSGPSDLFSSDSPLRGSVTSAPPGGNPSLLDLIPQPSARGASQGLFEESSSTSQSEPFALSGDPFASDDSDDSDPFAALRS